MSLSDHAVPATNAGFNYQFERAMLWLSKATAGARVGIETLDDVVIQERDGKLILEQDKLTLQSSAEPFGDRSKNLWNTIATWLESIVSGEVDLEQTHFMLVSNVRCHSQLALNISKAQTLDDARICVKSMLDASAKPSETIAPFTKEIFKDAHKDILPKLLLKIILEDAADSDLEQIRIKTIDALPIPRWAMNHKEEIGNALLGWLHKQVMNAWFKKNLAWISREDFITQFDAILHLLNRQTRREKMEHLIQLSSEQISQQKGSTFVKQIYLVADDDELAEESIGDYLRSNHEKMRLSQEGDITDADWIDFESRLRRHWKTISRRVISTQKEISEKEQGFYILDETTDYKEDLAGVPTEQPYLTKGAFHRLADAQTIGWHPKYKDLLK